MIRTRAPDVLSRKCSRQRRPLITLRAASLVVAKEHLNGQPRVATDLEAQLDAVDLLNLLVGDIPAVEVPVGLDTRLGDALGEDAPALVKPPGKENLLRGAALLLGDGEQSLVAVQGRVVAAEGGVAARVDALGGVVGHELGRGVARVKLNLVHSGDNLLRGTG